MSGNHVFVRWKSMFLLLVFNVIGFPSFYCELNRTLSLHSFRSYAHTSTRAYPSVLTETDSDPRFAEKHVSFGMDIVFINLGTSSLREHYMRETLRFYGFDDRQITRISAFRPEDIIVAPSLQEFSLCNHLSQSDFNKIISNSVNTTTAKVFLEATCGRKKNSMRELTVTLSHLLALHHTLYHSETFHNYALILEDDLHLYMEVDFEALINSAPSDFAVLQLVTSNDYSVSNLWRVFLRHKLLWVKRKDKDDYWCAGAYIVRKDALAPYLNKAFSQLEMPEAFNTRENVNSHVHHYRANIVAAYGSPCFPKSCCHGSKLRAISDPISAINVDSQQTQNSHNNISKNTNNNSFFNKEKLLQQSMDISVACVRSPRGLQSDSFLFTLAPTATYMLTIPIFTNSETGNVSTVHQRHVAWHQASFRRGRKILSVLLSGRVGVKLPTLLNPQCRIGSGVILHSFDINQNNRISKNSSVSEFDNRSDVGSGDNNSHLHWQSYLQEKHEQEEWIQGLLNRKHNILDT